MVEKLMEVEEKNYDEHHPVSTSAMMDNLYIERSKRCLYAYHNERCERLQKFLWYNGKDLPETVTQNLSKDEVTYFKNYTKLIEDYSKNAVKWNIDITTTLEPPRELYVEVKVLEDLGEVYLADTGTVKLQKNSVHYLKKSDIEGFLKQGSLIENDKCN